MVIFRYLEPVSKSALFTLLKQHILNKNAQPLLSTMGDHRSTPTALNQSLPAPDWIQPLWL